MTSTSTSPSTPNRSRRRAALAALVTAPLLAVALTSLAPSAEALPPRCDDPGAALCEPPDPPEPPPTRPIPTVPPTTSPPPPPPPTTWPVQARILDQAEGGLGGLTAERMWLPRQVIGQASAAFGPGDIGTIWDPIPAGSAPLVDGRFTFDAVSQPANTDMVLRVTEAGSPGPVCRTRLVGSQPPPDTRLRILAAPPMAVSAAQLQGMVDDFVGPVTGLEEGVEASISDATLTPTAAGLVLGLQGSLRATLFGTEFAFDFDADQLVSLAPSASTQVGTALVVSAAQLPTVTLDYTGPPLTEEAEENLEINVAPAVAPRIRSAVQRQAPGVVNSSVGTMPAVKWWTSQQFSLSIRSVQTSTAGLVVHPAVCRLG